LSSEWQFKVALREPDVGITGPWAVRKKVRQLVGQGVDAIKVFATGGGYQRHPLYPYWDDQRNFTLEEITALVDEAHSAGRRVAGHAMVNTDGIKNAIAAGIDTLEHGIFLDESDVAAMKAKEIIFIPTMAVMEAMWQAKDTKDMPYVHIDPGDAQKYLAAHKTSLKRAYAHGVKIAAGSDTLRVLKHGDNADELVSLVNSGLPEMEALAAATINGAAALGIETLVGSIEEGKLADLLVVDPNPLDNIAVLCNRQNLKLIIKNGEIVGRR
jgi:imidazolonepropionase-like amidohydrolase